jgi:hypothetical protein
LPTNQCCLTWCYTQACRLTWCYNQASLQINAAWPDAIPRPAYKLMLPDLMLYPGLPTNQCCLTWCYTQASLQINAAWPNAIPRPAYKSMLPDLMLINAAWPDALIKHQTNHHDIMICTICFTFINISFLQYLLDIHFVALHEQVMIKHKINFDTWKTFIPPRT